MKIIFLDVDGVLATPDNWMKGAPRHPIFAYHWNPVCVQRLNEIIEATDAQIVLSSTWRHEFNADTKLLKPLFEHNKVNRVPFDITPRYYMRKRQDEIKEWFDAANTKPEKFIILDDWQIDGFGKYFIRCDERYGITEEIKEKAIKLLNSK